MHSFRNRSDMRIPRRAPAHAMLAAAVFVGLLAAAPASADPPAAETFAQQNIDRGIAIMKDRSLSDAARHTAVHDLLLSIMDLKRIAHYVLGPAAQSAPPADVASFEQAFENFTLANYKSQIGAYGGQTLKVVGATAHAPGDYIVAADLFDPSDPPGTPPTELHFRVLDEGGKFAIVDANVEGIWFEEAQHDDVQGYLAQNGGSVPKLVDHLNAMAASFSAQQ